MRVLALAVVLAGCDEATWQCLGPDGELFSEGRLTCKDYRNHGDQLVFGHATWACEDETGGSCSCTYVTRTCTGGAND